MYFQRLLKERNIVSIYNTLLNISLDDLQHLYSYTSRYINFGESKQRDEIYYNRYFSAVLIQLQHKNFVWIHPNSVYVCMTGMSNNVVMRPYQKPNFNSVMIGSTHIVTDNEVHKLMNNPRYQTIVLEIKPFK